MGDSSTVSLPPRLFSKKNNRSTEPQGIQHILAHGFRELIQKVEMLTSQHVHATHGHAACDRRCRVRQPPVPNR
jgi:hypothetical protein